MKRPVARISMLAALLAALGASGAIAGPEPEPIGAVRALPDKPGPHWFWLTDLILHRTALFDADSGDMLGSISAGTAGVGFIVAPNFSPDRKEIYVAESYYSRGVRGDRTDVVTVYDGRTLQPQAEIPIPAKRAEYYPGNAANALSDDGRFLAVFNLTPMTSLSIVDVQARRFVGEVQAPGCSLVYAAGPRRFFMLCANGAALTVTLDDEGREQAVARTAPFFDANKDPLTEKAVRRGNEWLFVSYEGMLHAVDVTGERPRFAQPWPLLDDADRKASWRIGGAQHLAVHDLVPEVREHLGGRDDGDERPAPADELPEDEEHPDRDRPSGEPGAIDGSDPASPPTPHLGRPRLAHVVSCRREAGRSLRSAHFSASFVPTAIATISRTIA